MKKSLTGSLVLVLIVCLGLPALAQTKTRLSKKAEKIKSGMRREAVIEILGPATWAVLPADDGPASIADLEGVSLQLQWDNGKNCFPVTLHFDEGEKVIGIDHGSICLDDGIDPSWLPTSDYSCAKPDRSRLCGA
jgi:hypothetical protein